MTRMNLWPLVAFLSMLSLSFGAVGCTRPYMRPHQHAAPLSELPYHSSEMQLVQEDGSLRTRPNPWKRPSIQGQDVSTFSTDIDTASYSALRAAIRQGEVPKYSSVRVEEMINYFSYDDGQALNKSGHPLRIQGAMLPCPWNSQSRLLHVAVTGEEIHRLERPASNLVFLIDVSGSMEGTNRLGLIKRSLFYLTDQLDERDRITLITYSGRSRIVLHSTPGNQKHTIKRAIGGLHSGGSTNGGDGIRQAYQLAHQTFVENGNNRVILATDGDFNVGVVNQQELLGIIEEYSAIGIDLTILGVGRDNFKDQRLEFLSNAGDGNYFYLDSLQEGRKVFGTNLLKNMVTVAREVKAQVFFNPNKVALWRQIGYANRQLDLNDFSDDGIDGAEIGAGQTMIALYEIQLVRSHDSSPSDENPFIDQPIRTKGADNSAYLQLRLRYQPVQGGRSQLVTTMIHDDTLSQLNTDDVRWASLIAAWGLKLQGDDALDTYDWRDLYRDMNHYHGRDPYGYRREAVGLMERSMYLFVR